MRPFASPYFSKGTLRAVGAGVDWAEDGAAGLPTSVAGLDGDGGAPTLR
ncbi:MAG: hypothetical protein QM784_38750 [Polyangiaceae bacterium]